VVHLIAGVVLFAYVYVPKGAALDELIRLVVFPLLALSGIAMWKAATVRRALRRVVRGARAGARAL
jgi:hypothetical protein